MCGSRVRRDRARRPDVLIIDFDIACTLPTREACRVVGARVVTRLAEELNAQDLSELRPRSIIMAASSLDTPHRSIDESIIWSGLPILGVCNGAQILGRALGGRVYRLPEREVGVVKYTRSSAVRATLEQGTPARFNVEMAHDYGIDQLPPQVQCNGRTTLTRVASFESWVGTAPAFGIQFHPELARTQFGATILGRFVRLARLHGIVSATSRRWPDRRQGRRRRMSRSQ